MEKQFIYKVLERGTNKPMGTFKTRKSASNKVDKLDNAYGSYHYYVVREEK